MSGEGKDATYMEAVDAVVCINMDRRKDRWEAFCQTMQGVVPEGKIHRESAVVGKELPGYGEAPWFTDRTGERAAHWAGTAGCLLSHRNVIRRAKKEGWRNVLIFEDDAQSCATSEGMQLMAEAVRRFCGERYLLYLGYNGKVVYGYQVERKGASSLLRVDGLLAAHAYLVPNEMYEPLLQAMPQEDRDVWAWVAAHRAVDAFYAHEVDLWQGVKIYAVWPQQFRQSGSESDILIGKKYTVKEVRVKLIGRLCYAVYRMLRYPYASIKRKLDSRRMLRRALKSGFPGYRKKSAINEDLTCQSVKISS